jgi:hypothetical protein
VSRSLLTCSLSLPAPTTLQRRMLHAVYRVGDMDKAIKYYQDWCVSGGGF